jgi:hypothetical protein
MNQKTRILAIALSMGFFFQTKSQNLNSSVIDTPNYLAKMIPTESATSMRVYVGNIAHKKLQLSIKDIEGNEIYTRFLGKKQPQAAFRVDLSKMPNGIYVLELLDDDNNRSSKFFRKGNEVIAAGLTETLVALND